MTKRLAIIGAGDLGRQIAYHAKRDGHYEPVGFFDDLSKPGTVVAGLPVLGETNSVESQFKADKFDVLLLGIGYKHMEARSNFFERHASIPWGIIIHSSSYVDPSCTIGRGTVIYPGCTLDANTVIGDNVLVNAGCVIAHDSEVSANSFLSPAVRIAGFVTIGKQAILGIGTTIIDNIKITAGTRTGAGAVVVKSIDIPGLYLGVPAKLRENNNG